MYSFDKIFSLGGWYGTSENTVNIISWKSDNPVSKIGNSWKSFGQLNVIKSMQVWFSRFLQHESSCNSLENLWIAQKEPTIVSEICTFKSPLSVTLSYVLVL